MSRALKLAALVLGGLAFLLLGCAPSVPYACPDGSHCYGIAIWFLPPRFGDPLTNAIVDLDTPQMVGGDGHASNELWLIQDSCPDGGLFPQCWVEVGVIADVGLDPTETHFFWADNRPGLGFFFHDLGVVPPNLFGQPVELRIYRDPEHAYTFQAEIFSATTLLMVAGTSTNNAMIPNEVEIGFELEGTTGVATADAHFTQTEFSFDSSNPFNASFANWDGVLRNDPPVDSGWQIPPSQSSNGGRFHTVCCSW